MKTNEKELKQKIADLEIENQLLKNKITALSVDSYHLEQEKEVLRKSNLQLIVENKKLKEYENDYRVLDFILEECKFKLTKIDTFDIVNNEDKSIYFIEIYKIRNYHEFIAIEITEKQYKLFNLLNLRRI